MDKYIPDIYQKSIYTINYDQLYNRGIKCMLFDIDNTLVPAYGKEIDDKLKSLFTDLKAKGIEPIIFSDSSKKRVNLFKDSFEIDGYSHVHLFFNKKINAILSKYKEPEIAIVGDQMISDIAFGNKIGITTILVNPISNKDKFFDGGKRNKEKRIMTKLRNNNLFVKGRYYE